MVKTDDVVFKKVVDGYIVDKLVDVSTDTLIVSVSSAVNNRKLVKEFLFVFVCYQTNDFRYLWCAYYDRQRVFSLKLSFIESKSRFFNSEKNKDSGLVFLGSEFDLEFLRYRVSSQFLDKYC